MAVLNHLFVQLFHRIYGQLRCFDIWLPDVQVVDLPPLSLGFFCIWHQFPDR